MFVVQLAKPPSEQVLKPISADRILSKIGATNLNALEGGCMTPLAPMVVAAPAFQ